MKRRFFKVIAGVILFAVLAVIPQSQVSADVIFEPPNSFYQRHREECSYFGRRCLAGENARLWTAPNLSFGYSVAEEYEEIDISFVYTDDRGLEWGLNDAQGKWILMADLFLEYSSPEFMQEFADDIIESDPQILPADIPFVIWTYPESGEIREVNHTLPEDFELDLFYTDPDGRLWGYTAYMYGTRDVWVCLSDLNDTHISPRGEHELIRAQEADEEAIALVKRAGLSFIPVLIISVAAVVLISGLLIWRFRIKNKNVNK